MHRFQECPSKVLNLTYYSQNRINALNPTYPDEFSEINMATIISTSQHHFILANKFNHKKVNNAITIKHHVRLTNMIPFRCNLNPFPINLQYWLIHNLNCTLENSMCRVILKHVGLDKKKNDQNHLLNRVNDRKSSEQAHLFQANSMLTKNHQNMNQ